MIIEILDKMLLGYYALNLKQPNGIIMTMFTVKRQFESEIQYSVKYSYNVYGKYRSIPITFETDEPFISLQ